MPPSIYPVCYYQMEKQGALIGLKPPPITGLRTMKQSCQAWNSVVEAAKNKTILDPDGQPNLYQNQTYPTNLIKIRCLYILQ